jgi:hypothetical protein
MENEMRMCVMSCLPYKDNTKAASVEDMNIYDRIARRHLDSIEPVIPTTPGVNIIPPGLVDGT